MPLSNRRSKNKNKTAHKPICKSAGLGGFLNSHTMKRCHNRNRVGVAQRGYTTLAQDGVWCYGSTAINGVRKIRNGKKICK